MTIRCKMRLDDVISNMYGGRKAFFRCEYDTALAKEDVGFQMATPAGHAEYLIDNPKASAQLVIGAYYYVDFTPVSAPSAQSGQEKLNARDKGPTDQQIQHMVNRFLGWFLPKDFSPDAGISFKAAFNEHTAHPMKHEPSGTNLFSATQADAMVRHMVEGLPSE